MSKKRIQVMVEDDLYNQIEKESKEVGLSISSFIRLKLMERPLVIDGKDIVNYFNSSKEKRGL